MFLADRNGVIHPLEGFDMLYMTWCFSAHRGCTGWSYEILKPSCRLELVRSFYSNLLGNMLYTQLFCVCVPSCVNSRHCCVWKSLDISVSCLAQAATMETIKLHGCAMIESVIAVNEWQMFRWVCFIALINRVAELYRCPLKSHFASVPLYSFLI